MTRIRALRARATRAARGRLGGELLQLVALLLVATAVALPARALAQDALPRAGGWAPNFTAGPTADNRDGVVRLDFTEPGAPQIALSSGESGVWQDAASVTVTASGARDESSGAVSYQYSSNGGAWTGAASVMVSARGTTEICFRSVDGAGNIGVATSCALIRLGERAEESVSLPPDVRCRAAGASARCTWGAAVAPVGGAILGYKVYLNGEQVATIDGAAGGFHQMTGLANNVQYQFDVSAYGSDWESTRASAKFTPWTAPLGMVSAFALGSTTPAGWVDADGASLSRSDYATLYRTLCPANPAGAVAIGTAGCVYGAADATTFRLPDLSGRAIAGLDATQAEFNALGKTGGTMSEALTASHLPQHSHGLSSSHNHYIRYQRGGDDSNGDDGRRTDGHVQEPDQPNSNLAHRWLRGDNRTTGVSFQSNGSGTAHTNLQPYGVVRYLIAANGVASMGDAGWLLPVTTAGAVTGWQDANGAAATGGTPLAAALATTPDMQGRIAVGRNATQVEFDQLGEVGGSATVALSTAEMPAHSHGISDPGHNHTAQFNYGFDDRNWMDGQSWGTIMNADRPADDYYN